MYTMFYFFCYLLSLKINFSLDFERITYILFRERCIDRVPQTAYRNIIHLIKSVDHLLVFTARRYA